MIHTAARALPAALAAALAATSGCAMATYRPTEPRPVLGPGVMIDVVSVRGALNHAEVLLRTDQRALIGPFSWTSGDHESCSAEMALAVGHKVPVTEEEEAPPTFEITGTETVFVNLGSPPRPPGTDLFLDVSVVIGDHAGCMRVPLTAGDRTMWRAAAPPWSVSFGLRIEHPLAPLGGTGLRTTLETRVIRPLGPVRGFFGFTFGFAGCRGGNCPPETSDQGPDGSVTGVFGHLGGELGVDRRFELGRRLSLAVTLGASISGFHVPAPEGWVGDQNGTVAGPFASLALFGLGGDDGRFPGLAPEARRLRGGPELLVHRLTAFNRGPTETAWVVGIGWRVEGTN